MSLQLDCNNVYFTISIFSTANDYSILRFTIVGLQNKDKHIHIISTQTSEIIEACNNFLKVIPSK